MATAKLDQNSRQTLTALSSVGDGSIVPLFADPTTHRLLVDSASGGTGTVTNVTSSDASITITNPTTTPNVVVATSPVVTTTINTGVTMNGYVTTTAIADPATPPPGKGYVYQDLTHRVLNMKNEAGVVSNTVIPIATVANNVVNSVSQDGTVSLINANTLTAGTVTTNANLSGPITSVGNATSIASQTGTGSKIVVDTSPVLVTPNIGTPSSGTLTNCISATQAQNDNSTKLATTAYVDQAVIGQRFKEAAKYSTTGALPTVVYSNGSSGVGATLIASSLGAISLDGNTPSVNDRILVKNQASTFQNGIYTVTTVGNVGVAFVLTRALDFDISTEIQTGDSLFVTSGTTLSSTTWAYTGIDSPTIGTDAITWTQVAGQGSFTGGNGITITGTSIAIDTSITVDRTTAQTLSGKRVAKRVLALSANSATPAINTDLYDVVHITAQTAAITSFTTNLSGTPVDGDSLWISITGTAAVALTFGTSFEASTIALPATTATTARLDIGFKWNTETSKWRCVGYV